MQQITTQVDPLVSNCSLPLDNVSHSSNSPYSSPVPSPTPPSPIEIKQEPIDDDPHIECEEVFIQDVKEPHIEVIEDVVVQVDRANKVVDPSSKKPKMNRSINLIKPLIKKFKCVDPKCDLLFFTKIQRYLHMKLDGHLPASLDSLKQYYCYCGMMFRGKKAQIEHIRSNHNPKFKCLTCGKVSFSEVGCQRHLIEHGGGNFVVTLLNTFHDDDGFDVFR